MDLEQTMGNIGDEAVKQAVKQGWENKNHLFKLLGRALAFLRGKSGDGTPTGKSTPLRPIPILGPSGVGKSMLARVLSGDVNALLDPPPYYDPSLSVETVPLLGETGIELTVFPGEPYRFEREFGKFTADLVKGAFRGVILVVDYGYHAIKSARVRDHVLYEKGKRKEFLPKLLTAHRQEELDLLKKLVPSLMKVAGKLWVLVVVLKQDLWETDQARVEDFYAGQGEWSLLLNDVRKVMDAKTFSLHTTYSCLHIQNYTTSNGRETIKKNVAGYDSVSQRQALTELLEVFDALRDWEEQP